MSKSGRSTALATFFHFCQNQVVNMAANHICIKQKTKVHGKRRYAMVVILGIWVEYLKS